MTLARPVAFLSLFLTAAALATDPHPPQLAVSFLAEPAPIVQDGSMRLVYEIQIVNYTSRPTFSMPSRRRRGRRT